MAPAKYLPLVNREKGANMRQHEMRDEMNARFPARRGNIGQQMFRSCYFNSRMHGDSVEEAIKSSVEAVRIRVPGFVPIEH